MGIIVHIWCIVTGNKRHLETLIFISFIALTLAKVTQPTSIELCKTKNETSLRSCDDVILV